MILRFPFHNKLKLFKMSGSEIVGSYKGPTSSQFEGKRTIQVLQLKLVLGITGINILMDYYWKFQQQLLYPILGTVGTIVYWSVEKRRRFTVCVAEAA